jgi:hypothetical protein
LKKNFEKIKIKKTLKKTFEKKRKSGKTIKKNPSFL